jgi:putative phosphoesterase
MTLGVISDTHGFLDPAVIALFAGVEHILHGGDIGSGEVVAALERIAPVTAVSGNTDSEPGWRETEVLALGGRKFLVHHIVDLNDPAAPIHARIERLRPDVVVFGHTHKALEDIRAGRLYVNPGYAGKPRFNQPRSVAKLHVGPAGLKVEFLALAARPGGVE